jgi:hypothetical protein
VQRRVINTGCTTDVISPLFLAAINEVPFELDEPIATVSSKED